MLAERDAEELVAAGYRAEAVHFRAEAAACRKRGDLTGANAAARSASGLTLLAASIERHHRGIDGLCRG